MSCTCEGCLDTIALPDSFWFACTRYSTMACHLCGTCVSLIPPERRRPTTEKQEFKISFGPINADTGSFGRYQWLGSSQGEISFWVEAGDIDEYIPESKRVLKELYPFYCPEQYIKEMKDGITTGRAELNFELGTFLFQIHRFREALDPLSLVPKQHEEYQRALFNLVKSYRALQMKEEAEKWRKLITDQDMLLWLDGSNHISVTFEGKKVRY